MCLYPFQYYLRHAGPALTVRHTALKNGENTWEARKEIIILLLHKLMQETLASLKLHGNTTHMIPARYNVTLLL